MNFPTAHSTFPNKHLLFQTAWVDLDSDDFVILNRVAVKDLNTDSSPSAQNDMGGGYDSMGMLKGYRTDVSNNYIDYTYSYIGIGGSRKVSNIEAVLDTVETNMVHSYDSSGNLVKTVDSALEEEEEDTGTTDFVYNTQGQLLRKTTHRLEDTTPVEVYQDYFFAKGSQIASNGTLDGRSVDQIFQAISAAYPNQAPGQYTVQQGDTLESIAQQLWGDASLWYLIADANGLGGSSSLYQGKAITIPNSVIDARNSHSTFKPYNAQQAIGNTSPTLPEAPPAKGGSGGCGVAEILVTVVAVAVTVWTAGATAGALGVSGTAGGATLGSGSLGAAILSGGAGATLSGSFTAMAASAFVGGAVGNLAGQATAIGFGLQEGFDNKAALTGGLQTVVTAGAGTLGGAFTQATVAAAGHRAVNRLMGNEVSRHFDWRAVAINAVASIYAPKASDALKEKSALSAMAYNSLAGTSTNYTMSRLFNRDGTQDFVQVAITSFGTTLINELAVSAGNWMSKGATELANKTEQSRYELASSGQIMNDWELTPEERMFLDAMNPDNMTDRQMLDALIKSKPHALVSSNAYLEKGASSNDRVIESALNEAGLYRLNDKTAIEKQLGKDVDLKYYDESKGGFYDEKSGYFAALYYDSNNDKYILANRGTDQVRDLAVASLAEYLGEDTRQFRIARDIARNLSEVDGLSVEFTGHSLGGALASVQALATGNQAVTFNAKGLSNETIARYNTSPNDLITAITVKGELVNSLQQSTVVNTVFAAVSTPLHNTREALQSLTGNNKDPSFGLKTLNGALGRRIEVSASTELNVLQRNPLAKHGISSVIDAINYEEQRLMGRVYP